MGIVLEHVYKSYGSKAVLTDVSYQIPLGSICVLTAPSGAGKTTLLRLLLGLEKPDSGSIRGVPQKKSAVFQEDRLCPGLTVRGNLRMALPKYDEQKATALLRQLHLEDSLSTPACQLSGGMARRAALARALLSESELLTLDEPFTGLDEANRLAAMQAILHHRNGRTLLLVTHRIEELGRWMPEQYHQWKL